MALISPKFDNPDMLNPVTTTFGYMSAESESYYIDGAGWNGKVSKIAMCDIGYNGFIATYPEEKTNNQCEYLALIELLKYLKVRRNMGTIKVYTDSELMYKQLTNKYKTKDLTLLLLQQEVFELLSEVLWSVDLEWLPREQNKAGKLLEKDK